LTMETPPKNYSSTGGLAASMEPRSFDHGNLKKNVTRTGHKWLQWSHGLLTMETALNLVADVRAAVASMEPRSFDHGNNRNLP